MNAKQSELILLGQHTSHMRETALRMAYQSGNSAHLGGAVSDRGIGCFIWLRHEYQGPWFAL